MGLSTLRLAVVRLRHQWPLAAAQGLGLLAAVTLAVTVPLVQSIASEAGLHSVVERLGSKGFVTIEQFNVASPEQYNGFQRDAAKRVRAQLGDQLTPTARYAEGPRQPAYMLNGAHWTIDDGPQPDIATWEQLESHVALVAGSPAPDSIAADGTYNFTVSADAARDYTWKAGDVVCFNQPPSPNFRMDWCGRLTGTWAPRDAHDPYWSGTVPGHSLMLGRTSYFALIAYLSRQRSAGSTASQAWAPALGHLRAPQIAAFANQVNQLRGVFAVQRDGLFSTGIDTGVKDFRDRYDVASFTIQMVAAALLAIALYSVAFVAGHFLSAQAPTLAVLRGRGWSRRRVWSLLLIQFGLLAIAAIPLGLAAAWLLSRWLGNLVFGGATPNLDASDLLAQAPFGLLLAAALAAILGGLALLASRRSVLAVRRGRSRQAERPWWQWRNLDLVGAVVAVPMLAEVQLQGSGAVRAASADSSGDALNVVLPALALALLAVAALRLLPLAGWGVRHLSRGLPGALATWQLERQPVQHARLAVLMSFAVAVGLFSSIYAATDRANSADRAAYRSGADVRVLLTGFNTTPPDIEGAVDGLSGVAGSSMAFRGEGSPGRSNLNATVLAIDPGTFRQVAWSRRDLAAEPIDQLEQKLVDQDPDGVRLAGEPAQISMWVWSSGLGGELGVDLTDATGLPCVCSFGSLNFTGERVLTAPVSFTSPPRYPLRLRGFRVHTTNDGPHDGALAVGDLRGLARDGTSTVIESFEARDGWWQESQGPISDTFDLIPDLTHPLAGKPTATLPAHLFRGTLVFRPAPSQQALPALVSSQTLQALGVGLGQAFPMHVDTVVVFVLAVGVVDYFPTLYPGRDNFLILPRDSLLERLGHEHYSLAWPNEAWLKFKSDPAPAVKQLRGTGDLVDLEARGSLLADALGDPLRKALQSTLTIGFAAALAMAVVGFGLHFLVAARERHADYAILRANGMPAQLVQRSLGAEQAVLLLYSIIVGAALALLLAWAILPSVQVSPDLEDLVPPTQVHIDPLAAGLVLAAVLVVAFAAGQLASRLGGRFHLLDELRLLG
ncbi:MAG TPA: ABC transporter permease [Candidatus Dormibacteraeota bacterium]